MRRITVPIASALALLVLAACGGPGGGGLQPPANTIDVEVASSDPDVAVEVASIAPDESQVFRVTISDAVASADLLYVELDREVDLEVMTSGYGTVTYSAATRSYFGQGSDGLATSSLPAAGSAGVEPQSVSTPVTCRGSCVILDVVSGGTFYVRVTNTSGFAGNVDLFVYGDEHADENEPNDDLDSAPTFSLADAGAIETVGDVDYWYFATPASVVFDEGAQNEIEIEAWILDSNGNLAQLQPGPYVPGQTIHVNANEYLRVWAVSPRLGASSARSIYYLDTMVP